MSQRGRPSIPTSHSTKTVWRSLTASLSRTASARWHCRCSMTARSCPMMTTSCHCMHHCQEHRLNGTSLAVYQRFRLCLPASALRLRSYQGHHHRRWSASRRVLATVKLLQSLPQAPFAAINFRCAQHNSTTITSVASASVTCHRAGVSVLLVVFHRLLHFVRLFSTAAASPPDQARRASTYSQETNPVLSLHSSSSSSSPSLHAAPIQYSQHPSMPPLEHATGDQPDIDV